MTMGRPAYQSRIAPSKNTESPDYHCTEALATPREHRRGEIAVRGWRKTLNVPIAFKGTWRDGVTRVS